MAWERISVVGNIGTMTVTTSSGGRKYGKMSVAVNRGVGASQVTIWYNVLLFGDMVKDEARLKANYTVGRLVLVEGRPQTEAYLSEGKPKIDNAIIATTMPELLDRRPGS